MTIGGQGNQIAVWGVYLYKSVCTVFLSGCRAACGCAGSEGGQLVSFLQRQNKLCSASAQPVPRMVRLHICGPVCTYMMCTAVVSRHLQLLDCRCEVAQLCMHASKICACLLQQGLDAA